VAAALWRTHDVDPRGLARHERQERMSSVPHQDTIRVVNALLLLSAYFGEQHKREHGGGNPDSHCEGCQLIYLAMTTIDEISPEAIPDNWKEAVERAKRLRQENPA
jgi:hypothetical protein